MDREDAEELATLDDGSRPRLPDHDRANGQRPSESEGDREVLALPSLYAKAELQAHHIPRSGGGGTVADKRRRVLHFTRPVETRSGRWKFAGVVVMIPGRQLWVAQTIDDATRQYQCWECFGPTVDPFHALAQIEEKVIDYEMNDETHASLKRMWRHWRGRRVWSSTSYAQILIGLDVKRARKPEQLRDWLLENVPQGRQPSAACALRVGARAQLRDFARQI